MQDCAVASREYGVLPSASSGLHSHLSRAELGETNFIVLKSPLTVLTRSVIGDLLDANCVSEIFKENGS